MSGFFDELEGRLRASAAELHGSAPRRRIRPRPLLVLAAAILLGGAAVPAVPAITGLWEPEVEPQRPWGTQEATISFSCRERSPRFRPGRAIGPEFARAFSVFARPQRASDRMERKYLRTISLLDLDPGAIRRIGTTANGRAIFLAPGYGIGNQPPSRRCLERMPAEFRRHHERAARQASRPAVCVIDGGGSCSWLGDFARFGTYSASGVVRGRATIAGVVPDGVRAVRVTYGRSTRTFPVTGNAFSFRLGIDVEQAQPDRLEWLMADGSVRDVTR